jgi:hypothetical protein
MKSTFKLMMVAAAAVFGSSGVFAQATGPITCATEATTLTQLVNSCAPEVTFYISGASAQSAAITALMANGGGILDFSKVKGRLTSTSGTTSGLNTTAWIGYGATTAGTASGKRVLVVYNRGNGSGAGVNLLLTGKGTGAGEEVQLSTATVKNLAKRIVGTCVVTEPASLSVYGAGTCATEAAVKSGWGIGAEKAIHMAISDVRPSELAPGVVKKWDLVKYPATSTVLQGFGVAVSPLMYKALQSKDVTAGRIASTCNDEVIAGTNGSTQGATGACQPSISRADYASIITGQFKNIDALTGNGNTTDPLYLARRVVFSGTQSASNIAFANQAGYNAKTALNTMAPIKAAGTFALTGSATLVVTEGAGTGDVLNQLRNNGGTATFAIGVVSLENLYSTTVNTSSGLRGALYVKVDGMSPNYTCTNTTTCTLDTTARESLKSGYPLAFEAVTVQSSTLAAPYSTIAGLITNGLKDAALSNLAGMAYYTDSTGSNASRLTAYSHGGNNYLPLVKNK